MVEGNYQAGIGHQASIGAPLWMLSFVIAFWTLGRVIWELSTVPTNHDLAIVARPAAKLPLPAKRKPRPLADARAFKKFSQTIALGTAASNEAASSVAVWEVKSNASTLLSPVMLTPQKPQQIPFTVFSFAPTAFNNFMLERKAQKEQGKKIPPRKTQAQAMASPTKRDNRLSGYFWLYHRPDNAQIGAPVVPRQAGISSYGGSQAGGILSYRFANIGASNGTGSGKRHLSGFTRVSAALENDRDRELAVGLSAKPVDDIPITIYAERRFGPARNRYGNTAIYIAGGTGPDRLIENLELETYGQAGYIFSERNSHFFDGSAVVQRDIAALGGLKLSVGGGLWAGGQRGVSRVDVGPRASLSVPAGGLNSKISVDWRFRATGNAVPDNGPALTLTTGF